MLAFLSHFSALLTVACVAGLWQGFAIVAIGFALCNLMPRASAALRHSLLLVLFSGALVLPWIQFERHSEGSSPHAVQLAPWIAALIAFSWVAAVVLRGGQLYLAWRHLCAVRRNAIPLELQGATEVGGGRRRALLCSSAEVSSPSILGFGSPRLLLPDWMVPLLSEAELQQIVLHECEHLRRGDDWINLLLQVGMTLSPLNPALLWLNSRIHIQRELAVDSAVVMKTSEPLSYASCLTRLAEQRRDRGRLRLALAAWERRSELSQRVHALLNRPAVWTKRQSGWAAGVAATGLLSVASFMARAPELVQVNWPTAAVLANEVPASMAPSADAGAHMVPASFQLPTHYPSAERTRQSTDGPAGSLPDLKPAPTFRSETTQRATRAQSARPKHTTHSLVHSPRSDEFHVHMVTTAYYFPYVAVPVSDGWLLLEL